ncbi:MAG: hypothetical protein ACK56F_10325, partial [bacterium]
MAASARPCAARTRLFELIATSNGRCAPTPPIYRSFAASYSSPRNKIIPFRPEVAPPGAYI